jgi:hypothetical protein
LLLPLLLLLLPPPLLLLLLLQQQLLLLLSPLLPITCQNLQYPQYLDEHDRTSGWGRRQRITKSSSTVGYTDAMSPPAAAALMRSWKLTHTRSFG